MISVFSAGLGSSPGLLLAPLPHLETEVIKIEFLFVFWDLGRNFTVIAGLIWSCVEVFKIMIRIISVIVHLPCQWLKMLS